MRRFQIKFNSVFINDLDIACKYYLEASVKVEIRFKIAVNDQIKLIKKNPFVKSIRYDDVRLARIDRFPYAMHYSIDESNHLVSVHRLLSDYQNLVK